MVTPQPQQPLVCTSLHLPPDPQPLLRIHEISLYIFLPNLERLQHDLKTAQDVYPRAYKDFHRTLRVLTSELVNVFRTLQVAQMLAERYHKVLDALKQNSPTDEALFKANLSAGATVLHAQSGQESLSVFRREFERGIERARTTTPAKIEKGQESLLNSAKNVQSISEILAAIDECDELLQQCQDEFGDLEKRTKNKDAIDSDPPSEEEIQLIRAKWDMFLDDVNDVYSQGFEIANEISMSTSDTPQYFTPENREPRQKTPLWRALFQRENKRDLIESGNLQGTQRELMSPCAAAVIHSNSHETPTDVDNRVSATQKLQVPKDTAASVTAPSGDHTASKPKVTFWRRIFRRVNNSPPQDASARPEPSGDTPNATAPRPKAAFWRRFFRWPTRVSTTPSR